jgi:hypothetical protein
MRNILEITTDENVILTSNFTKEGVYEAISQMKHNKAHGPDGFPTEFYHIF